MLSKKILYDSLTRQLSKKLCMAKSTSNRLIGERSPYLLQHANNPVDWYPWGSDAFQKAKAENKLIFLSVGYSTCHWCHVMERESFENVEISKLLNDHFVAIKVDREERPDVDKIYMTFVQATTGSGGWPMSVWLTPDLKPIVGGTYFPPDDRYFGRPGFASILKFVAQQWKEKPNEVLKQEKALTEALIQATNVHANVGDAQLPDPDGIDRCHDMIAKSFDPLWGGFGNAPKFPQPVNFDFMVRYAHWKWGNSKLAESKPVEMVRKTLTFMANGGIHDHVAKGFHRYSTDKKWHVPHFEKMLYDQAQLVAAYVDIYQISKDESFKAVVEDILSYVSRDLSHPAGGFYSAEDADSLPTSESTEKKEGAFCVWTEEEIRSALVGKVESDKEELSEADVFCKYYNVKEDGNLEAYQDPHGELTGQNVLIVYKAADEIAQSLGISEKVLTDALEKCRDKLYAVRLTRPKPHLDNKILTSWNGLMISGYAKAAISLNNRGYADRAVKAAEFIENHLMNGDKQLLRSAYVTDDGNVAQLTHPIGAFADDYAFFIAGLLDLYDVTFNTKWLKLAERIQAQMDELLWDADQLGYFTSSTKDASIILRLKEDQDGAEPSANSVAAINLIRLSVLLSSSGYMEKCHQILSAFGKRLNQVPIILPKMQIAYMWYLKPPTHVTLVGELDDPKIQVFLDTLRSHFLPHVIVTLVDSASTEFLKENLNGSSLPGMVDNQPTAYVCKFYSCGSPIVDPEVLLAAVTGESHSV